MGTQGHGPSIKLVIGSDEQIRDWYTGGGGTGARTLQPSGNQQRQTEARLGHRLRRYRGTDPPARR